MAKVEVLWNNFYQNSLSFKDLINKNDPTSNNLLKNVVDSVHYKHSLLNEVDNLVSMYGHSETKSNI